jgi:hypothetical protein
LEAAMSELMPLDFHEHQVNDLDGRVDDLADGRPPGRR